jgi:hypothetical protein
MKKLIGLVLALTLICFTAPATAFNQPLGINLGFTNFIDGASPGPGWYWTEYFQLIHATELNDVPFPLSDDVELDVFVNLNQFIYQSDVKFLGGNPGLDVIIPLVDIDVEHFLVDGVTQGLNGQDGFGDILIGPFMQWGPHMVFNRPFFQRFEFQVTAPTGENDSDVALNPGANVWTINPYYAFTYFITPKLTTSWRIHYLWSEENDDTDIQAGQAIHFNYALAYAVSDTVRLGVAGYYLNQLEEDEFDGHNVDDSEEEVFAIGPGLVWHITKDLTFMSAINWETHAENRPEGVRTTFRLIWKFW